MIPEFPQFKKLELSDKEEIQLITASFEPYSDFNFTSMWSWDIFGNMRISLLNNNLIVKFNDYIDGKPFYSFLGNQNPSETIQKLLDLSEKEGIDPILKLIPHDSIKSFDLSAFKIEENEDNFDYILLTEKIKNYEGSDLASKRRYANKFLRDKHNFRFDTIDLNVIPCQQEIKDLFSLWTIQKGYEKSFTENESLALERFLDIKDKSQFISYGLWMDEKLSAFWLLEKVSNTTAISHFEKADTKNAIGTYAFIMKKSAEMLMDKGITHINLEQDLGISGMRVSKKSFCPVNYLKKYTIQKKNLSGIIYT